MSIVHGGNVWRIARELKCKPEEIFDFSASLNPIGPPNWIEEIGKTFLSKATHYPDIEYWELREKAAFYYGVKISQIWPLNGSSALFPLLPFLKKVKQIITFPPCFGEYISIFCEKKRKIKVHLESENNFLYPFDDLEKCLEYPSLVILAHPNNPTNSLLDFGVIKNLANKYPESIFVLDLAFWDFLDPQFQFKLNILPNIVYVFSLTKILGLPGVRIGFVVSSSQIIESAQKMLPPWSVGTCGVEISKAYFSDDFFVDHTRQRVKQLRQELISFFQEMGAKVYPSCSNFILIQHDKAKQLAKFCFEHRVILRECDSFEGLGDNFLRIAVRPFYEQEHLFQVVREFFGQKQVVRGRRKNKKNKSPKVLMVQGTASNVGKSFLVAALGRILARKGVKVAPFKAQNMALNSFVTKDGLEIGRAQALQAQACFLEPDIRMNPILLKPSSEIGAQVIVRGQPVSNMSVEEYIAYKPKAFEVVKECFRELSLEYDVILVEGAGSPVEINLKTHDIVNMNFALWAKAKVLLVGDINLGGIFASFWGTFSLLTKEEQNLILGFIINKFRGRKRLLNSGLDFIYQLTGKPVLGIIPYVSFNLPEEDSVSFKQKTKFFSQAKDRVKIGIIDLPHISNFTDFDALKMEIDVDCCIIRSKEDLLDNFDVVIIPGTKNVFFDLKFLHSSGIATWLLENKDKLEIVGICGGYQMLGSVIQDDSGWEGKGEISGLGLLPVKTEFKSKKSLFQTKGKIFFQEKTFDVSGYEIHHGETKPLSDLLVFGYNEKKKSLGYKTKNEKIWGTYLHGIFDNDDFRHAWLNNLRSRKGLSILEQRPTYTISQEIDKLADLVEENIELDLLDKIIG
ncbi:adenosylcobyric acid synthase (glutamine-hydrolysing) [Desulfonauticus submarinus]|uniref:Cobyric acid synthase n=1 Tax=Desulfonauticus submarinus TaxID=206665 RepID=A0A1H0GGZ6_9BACT|nr:cobyric acid synthase [Desulfonauticus submarinus]SDO06009.1 adenosylcobyric acid synthase (glutamine-hydrolysing) [Desulfonauticus submarinus]